MSGRRRRPCSSLPFQLIWASPVAWVATVGGQCPCGGLLIGGEETGLRAVGSDRLAGLIFLLEALAGLGLMLGRLRRA
jgi:hypothetical protein